MTPQPDRPKASPQKKKPAAGGRGYKLLGYALAALVWLSVGVGGLVSVVLWKISSDLPEYDYLARYEPAVVTRVYASDGSLIAEYAREKRLFVPIGAVPKLVIAAFLSAEDRRFYEHGGLDFTGILRAVVTNLQHLGRKRPEGASTITQQVAKNFLLSSDQNLERKLKEAVLAFRIERTYSKDKILELYLNEIYLGMQSYGVAAAALNYFDKELRELTIEEAAFLAVLPKAPNNYHPIRRAKEATVRRDWIIDQMADAGYITSKQAEAAKSKPLVVNPRPLGPQVYAADYFAEDIRRTLVANFGEDGILGRPERGTAVVGRANGGLTVKTTLDPRLQRIAREVLVNGLVSYDREGGWRGPVKKISVQGDWVADLNSIDAPEDIAPWRLGVVLEVNRAKAVVGKRPLRQVDGNPTSERETVEIPFEEVRWARSGRNTPKASSDVLSVGDVIWVAPKDPAKLTGAWTLVQIPEIDGGLVAMDPHTGRIYAVAGGFSFASSQFDRALQARRQPGSVFKPFVYAAALENGYKPTSIVLDTPIDIELTRGRVWQPKNYDGGSSLGPSTLRTGIEKSRNQMTVRLAQGLGMPLIVDFAKRFGIYDDLLPVLSMSLGAGETTLLRMCAAYAALDNGGKQVRPTLIDRIQDRWGQTIWRHDNRECRGCKSERWTGQPEPDLPDDRKQIVDPVTAYQLTSMMEGVVQRGTGTIVKKIAPDLPLAGKTGTTNDEKDAWFVGYSPDLVVGVFVGYDTPDPMGKGMTGGHLAAPIFANFMKMALADTKAAPFRLPSGIKLIAVNLRTGLRAQNGDREGDVILEAFKPDQQPDETNPIIGSPKE